MRARILSLVVDRKDDNDAYAESAIIYINAYRPYTIFILNWSNKVEFYGLIRFSTAVIYTEERSSQDWDRKLILREFYKCIFQIWI